jgi:hypothetical protein
VKFSRSVGLSLLAAFAVPPALVGYPFPAPQRELPKASRKQIKEFAPMTGLRHGGYKSAYKCAKAKGKNGRGFKRRLLGWS